MEEKKKRGRPRIIKERTIQREPMDWFSPEGLAKIKGWCRNDGCTLDELAEKMNVSTSTLDNIIRDNECFREIVADSKAVIDTKVEESLLRRALGYEYTEESEKTEDSEKEGRKVTVTRTVKKVVPDVTACIFWLKNRKPRDWRDKRDLEVTNKIGIADALKEARERARLKSANVEENTIDIDVISTVTTIEDNNVVVDT